MFFKRIFKRGKKENPESESHASQSRAHTPSSDITFQSTSPPPTPSVGVSTLAPQSSASLLVSPLPEPNETKPTVLHTNTWTNLTAFSSVLNLSQVFAPLAAVIDDLSWFVREHENAVKAREEYSALHTQLEASFKDLLTDFSAGTPPAMTTSMLNLCAAIETRKR
ncbi:hypothetical protein RSOLAG22IIIB_05331 [Rhizoctonia solani]|uniref:Uncharacterized protein n=1 Tax=Rhizoctonia solani TaxID=456999 RepID=A0A0K6G4P3_9AGAM|nr:hypothetical protein RSOLAG22IIIB_05331 [Rhizoctonia solani]